MKGRALQKETNKNAPFILYSLMSDNSTEMNEI